MILILYLSILCDGVHFSQPETTDLGGLRGNPMAGLKGFM